MIQEKMKPCPFCGGEAEVVSYTTTRARIPQYHPNCKSCKCWESCLSEEEAIAVWNRRCGEVEEVGESDWRDAIVDDPAFRQAKIAAGMYNICDSDKFGRLA